MRPGLLSALALLIALPSAAAAQTAADALPLGPDARVVEVRYACTGMKAPLAVTYVTDGPNSLAVVPVEGAPLIMAATMSGSGVRYMGGFWLWWDQGDHADLYDQRTPERSSPNRACEPIAE